MVSLSTSKQHARSGMEEGPVNSELSGFPHSITKAVEKRLDELPVVLRTDQEDTD